ncbi:MAG: hybrid sensor histidine kinase/response regulator [Deltaproteobacteria bacterium]
MAKYDILLVGDGTNLLHTIGWVLEYKGFAVKATGSPEAALEALVKKNYDLVLAKLTADNREVLNILERAKRLNPGVKVMAISSNGEAVFPLEAYEVEIDDYILMPVSPTELWRRVNQCLEGQEVVDLQPVRLPSGITCNGDQTRSQTMLMLHDLRGAMVSTASVLKLMVRGFYGDMNPSVHNRLQEVSGRVENLIHLTEEFLGKTLATTWPKARKREGYDLRKDIVEPVLAELASEIRDHRITLENRLPERLKGKIPVRGNKLWLKSVFRNLITNGIKYGGNGCTIVVDLETQGAHCRLNVYNTGKTIPEAHRSLLFSFEPEMRRSKKGLRGLGLGLPLSRDILQNHGGDMWYEPRSDGSNFVVSLPR